MSEVERGKWQAACDVQTFAGAKYDNGCSPAFPRSVIEHCCLPILHSNDSQLDISRMKTSLTIALVALATGASAGPIAYGICQVGESRRHSEATVSWCS